MGIIETIKKITFEEGIERGIEEGIEKGLEQKTYEIIHNLLKSKKLSISEIAEITNVPVTYVEKVMRNM